MSLKAAIFTSFYLILIAIIISSLLKTFDPPTAFEEYEDLDDAKLPSFTICPNPMADLGQSYEPIESFEGAMAVIEDARKNFSVQMFWTKSFAEA